MEAAAEFMLPQVAAADSQQNLHWYFTHMLHLVFQST